MADHRENPNNGAFSPDLAMATVGLGAAAAFFAGIVLRPSNSPPTIVWASALCVAASLLYSQFPRPKNIRSVRSALLVESLFVLIVALALTVYLYLVGQLLIFWHPTTVHADWNEVWHWTFGAIALTSLMAVLAATYRVVRRD